MVTAAMVNGVPKHFIEIFDRGFQYGDGVFTTIRVENGIPLFLGQHIQRLSRDGQQLMLPPPDIPLLISELYALIPAKWFGIVKVFITRGVGRRGYRTDQSITQPTRVLIRYSTRLNPGGHHKIGASVRLCSARLGYNLHLAGVKHLNRLEQILARMEWTDLNIDEGLMMDQDGHVVEGTMTNIFILKSGTLFTPRIDRCGVLGVMRSIVISLAKGLAIPFEETRIGITDLYAADEIFLTNSIVGIWPVCRFQDMCFNQFTDTRRMMCKLESLIAETIATA